MDDWALPKLLDRQYAAIRRDVLDFRLIRPAFRQFSANRWPTEADRMQKTARTHGTQTANRGLTVGQRTANNRQQWANSRPNVWPRDEQQTAKSRPTCSQQKATDRRHTDRQKMDNGRIDFDFGLRRRVARRSRSTSIDTISRPFNRWPVECKSF